MARPATESAPLFFAHANGFPAGAYRRFLAALSEGREVLAVERLGHRPEYPVDREWRGLTHELLDSIAAQAGAEPVIGVGHSMGGVLMFLAASRQPGRFRQIIMLDPPVSFGWSGWLLIAMRALGRIDRVTPAGRSVGRRQRWPDLDAAIDDLSGKRLFRDFDRIALSDYLAAATEKDPDNGGLRLSYRVDVEVAVFRNIPALLPLEPSPLPCPGDIAVARDSAVTRPGDLRRMVGRHGFGVHRADGDHLFPLTRPAGAAALVRRIIASRADTAR